MPTVEELDKLTALLGRLGPLSDQQPGELITAGDWNVVVGAILEIARALVQDTDLPVKPHEHPDQVALGWLDPRLRTLVENGPVGDPAAVARVSALELADTRLQATLDELAAQVADLRERGRDVATRDLERESAVNGVRRKIEGLADARDDVADVRASLDSVRERVARAVELGEALQAGGEPVDLGALKARVDDLAALRDGLTLPTGERLDAVALERRLTELRNQLVTQEDLDDALKDHQGTFDPAVEAAIEGRVQAKLDAELGQREDGLRAELLAAADAKLAGVDALVAQRVSDATPGVREQVLAAARDELSASAKDVLEQAGAGADTRVKAGIDTLRAELGSQLDGLRDEVPGLVGSTLADQLPPALGELRASVDSLRADLGGLAARVDKSATDFDTLDARVTEVARATTEQIGGLRRDLKTGIEGLQDDLGLRVAKVETRVDDLDGRVGRLDTGLDGRLNELVDARDAQLRDEFSGIAKDQLAGFEDRLPTLVSGQVQKVSAATIRNIALQTINERFGPG